MKLEEETPLTPIIVIGNINVKFFLPKTSFSPTSDLAFKIASFVFPNSKLLLENKQADNPN